MQNEKQLAKRGSEEQLPCRHYPHHLVPVQAKAQSSKMDELPELASHRNNTAAAGRAGAGAGVGVRVGVRA